MEPIANTEELRTKRAGKKGYIYNDDQAGPEMHVLHYATCTALIMATVPPHKYFSLDLQEAVSWLNVNRGQENANWHRCRAQNMKCFG